MKDLSKYNGFMPNYPMVKEGIDELIKQLEHLKTKDNTHLADIGFLLNCIGDETKELSKKTFELHETALNLTEKQIETT